MRRERSEGDEERDGQGWRCKTKTKTEPQVLDIGKGEGEGRIQGEGGAEGRMRGPMGMKRREGRRGRTLLASYLGLQRMGMGRLEHVQGNGPQGQTLCVSCHGGRRSSLLLLQSTTPSKDNVTKTLPLSSTASAKGSPASLPTGISVVLSIHPKLPQLLIDSISGQRDI